MRWRVDGGEEPLESLLPGPCLGQADADPAGAGGDPGWQIHEPGPDGPGPGPGERSGSEDPGGAGEVVGHHRADQPGAVGPEVAGGQVGQGAVFQVGVDLLDDRVLAVGPVRARCV